MPLRILCFGASLVQGLTSHGTRFTPFGFFLKHHLQAKIDEMRVLCFGDSLTEGYTRFGTKFAPYGKTMENLLREREGNAEGQGGDVDVMVEGQSGELVTDGFEERCKRVFATRTQPSKNLDFFIFLGGTNDIGWGKVPQPIYDTIQRILSFVRKHEADREAEEGSESSSLKILLCTIPECGVKNADLDARRDGLNALIRGVGEEDVYIFDLHKRIKYHTMPEEERDEIWDDGLHFTEAGYERVGKMVGERIWEIMKGERGREDKC